MVTSEEPVEVKVAAPAEFSTVDVAELEESLEGVIAPEESFIVDFPALEESLQVIGPPVYRKRVL